MSEDIHEEAFNKGAPTLRELAKHIIEYMKKKGFVLFRRKIPEIVKQITEVLPPEKLPGKFYTRIGGDLYIYVKEKGDLIDLDLFQEEMGLFGQDLAWRMNSWMAIVKNAPQEKIDRAEIILGINGFQSWRQHPEKLEEYFVVGDSTILGNLELSMLE
jgi:hypothetical protein